MNTKFIPCRRNTDWEEYLKIRKYKRSNTLQQRKTQEETKRKQRENKEKTKRDN